MAENTRLLDMLQKRYLGYHPVVAMAEMAHESNIEDRIKFDCHKEIAKYIEPQLKSVEHRGKVKTDYGVLRVVSSLPKSAPVKALEDKSEDSQAIRITQDGIKVTS